jgi:hypothetical protein
MPTPRRYRNPLTIAWNGRFLSVRGVDRAVAALNEAAKDALEGAAEDVLAEADRQVPMDTGALRASGRIEHRPDRVGPRFDILYGGPGIPYAFHVHEMNKNYRRRGSKWRYVIDPMQTKAATLERELQTAVQSAMRFRNFAR